MEEEFKILIEYPNYKISNNGKVINRKTGMEITPQMTCSGYYYFQVNKNRIRHNLYIHKLLGEYFIPNPDNKTIVDHIDRNRSNNQMSNLRWANKSENSINCKTRNDNTSGCKGVCYNKRANMWLARITKNNRTINIGYFKNFEDAIIARNNKEIEVFGSFIPESINIII